MKYSNGVQVLKLPRKSTNDSKDYKLFKLQNGLKVLLVKQGKQSEEKSAHLASVALAVGSGCFNDPPEVQGMSHLIEHLIFAGSEKFPRENEFDQFVSAHLGFDNAYTDCQQTVFHFDVIEKQLAGALDRFANLFIAPIMSVSSMEREIQAIESEFQNNSSDDEVRVGQMFAAMIEDDHPAGNFIWGNLETLWNRIDLATLNRKAHEFWKKNYVASQMFLCIQSSLEMNRLERTVVNYFADIPSGSAAEIAISQKPFDIFKPCFTEKMFFVKPATEKSKLLVTFALPAVSKDIKFLDYLAYLIQYEGQASLSDLYMDELLALKVKAKVGFQSFEGNSFFTLFTIEINLTSRGCDNIDNVLRNLFSFLLLLKVTQKEQHEKLYNEFKEIKETLFMHQNEKPPLDNVQELAVNMNYFEDSEIIIGKECYPDFDWPVLSNFIASINKRSFNLLFLTDKYHKYDKTERWFGTEYAEIDFPSKFTKLWNERWLRKDLHLPTRNEFVCKSFELLSQPEGEVSSKFPRKIFHNESCECYYKFDDTFKLPHGYIYVNLISHLTQQSAINLNMTSIYSMCVKNFLSEKLFQASVVGYHYKLNSVDSGLILRLDGFNEKLPLLLNIITKLMKDTCVLVDKTVYETFRKELRKNCHHCLMDLNLLNDDCRISVIRRDYISFRDRLDCVDDIKFAAFKEFCEKLLKSLKIHILIQGNILQGQANEMVQSMLENLSGTELSSDMNPAEVNELPPTATYLNINSLRHDKNSVIKNYYQITDTSVRSECLAEIVVSTMFEPLFDKLRTQEQLGYCVTCTYKKSSHSLGIILTVEYQEDRNCASFIDERIESFLNEFFVVLKSINQQNFEQSKRSLVSLKEESDTDLEKEVNRNFNEIRIGEFLFDRNEIEALEMENLTKENIVQFYEQTFLSPNTRKLSVQVVGNVKENQHKSSFDSIKELARTLSSNSKVISH